jgi:hypothetical protein
LWLYEGGVNKRCTNATIKNYYMEKKSGKGRKNGQKFVEMHLFTLGS